MRILRKTLITAAVFILFLSTSACKTSSEDADEDLNDPMMEGQSSENDIPMELWTPSRRQVNAYYFFMVAEYESLNNNRQLAKKYYEDAYNLDPNAYLGAKLIASRATIDDSEDTLLQARKMVLLYPKEVDIQILYGQLLANRGLLKEAKKAFEKSMSLDETRLEPYIGLIGIERASGNASAAIAIAKAMLEIESSFADGWALLSKLYLTTDQRKKALEPAKRAYDLMSNDPEKVHLYALCLELNGESKKAVSLYEVVFRLNPNNDELIQRMVALYKQIGSLNDALKLLKDAEERIDKPSLGLSLQMVFIHWELEQFSEASKILDKLKQEHPNSDRILYMAALGQEKIGRLNESLKTYSQIPKQSEFYVHGAYRSIRTLRELKSYDEALKLAQKVVDLKVERSVDFYNVIANIYADQKRYEEAIDTLEAASKKHPKRSDILFLLGVYQEKNGELSDSKKTMRQVIKVDPENSGAYNYLGYLFAEKGENLDEAEELIKKALELKPGDGYYLDSLGWVYYQQKKYNKALEVLKKANAATPNEAVILEHLGDCYLALGQDEQAYRYFREAIDANMEERDRERILKKFEEIKKKFQNSSDT